MAAPDFLLSAVETRPQRTFTVDAVDYKSVWNTLHNPIRYVIGVFGDIIDLIDNTITGGVDCYMHDATIAATYTVGDKIYLYSTALTGYSVGYYTVTNVSGNYITIDAIYVGDVTGTGYITNFNLKRNFKIEVEVWAKLKYDNETPTLISTSRYTPAPSYDIATYGQLKVKSDISGFLQGVITKVEDEIDYDLSFVNLIDINNFTFFYIRYRESYTNSIDAFIDDRDNPMGTAYDDPNTCYASKSVKQLMAKNGGSLFEYETFDFDRLPQAKFISGFSRPKYYGIGYPFDLTFIDSLVMFDDGTFEAYFTPYSSGGVAGTEHIVSLDIWSTPSIQRLMIDLPFGDEGDWDNAFYFSVRIGTNTDDTFISEIYIDIENALQLCNPVYLKAKNDLGCWDYFMFQRNQDVIQDSVSGGVFNQYVSNLETNNTNSDYISKLSKNSMVIGANGIGVIDFEAYKSLARSPKVYMLTNSAYPWTWQTVKLRGNTIKRNTRQSTFDCEFVLEMPDVYNLMS
jgi:hypothetical protein